MPFNYPDTASSRAEISHITEKLANSYVAIVGLGGTGSYVLDFVAKTPVKEIHIFDDDEFVNHNAFRSPGAPTLELLEDAPSKVEYFAGIYSAMHRHIYTHGRVDEENIDQLKGMGFVFVSVDDGPTRRLLAEKLTEYNVPFVDVGMGLFEGEESIGGLLRVTTSTSTTRAEAEKQLPVSNPNEDDIYATNIQVAELNALNAALAVIRWKKLMGFYIDRQREYSTIYQVGSGVLIHEGLGA